MRKIPTLFQRDWDGDRRLVLPQYSDEFFVQFGVPVGEAFKPIETVPTAKRDGTACLWKDGCLFKRYDAKHGRPAPAGFEACGEADQKTGHMPGWVPVGAGPEDRWHVLATLSAMDQEPTGFKNVLIEGATYELCGPKVNGNPEGFETHELIRHGSEVLEVFRDLELEHEAVRHALLGLGFEGVVWWGEHPAGTPTRPLFKIKRRDFGFAWPIPVGGGVA